MKIKEVYEKYKHFDTVINDERLIDPNDIPRLLLRDMWNAIKESITDTKLHIDEEKCNSSDISQSDKELIEATELLDELVGIIDGHLEGLYDVKIDSFTTQPAERFLGKMIDRGCMHCSEHYRKEKQPTNSKLPSGVKECTSSDVSKSDEEKKEQSFWKLYSTERTEDDKELDELEKEIEEEFEE